MVDLDRHNLLDSRTSERQGRVDVDAFTPRVSNLAVAAYDLHGRSRRSHQHVRGSKTPSFPVRVPATNFLPDLRFDGALPTERPVDGRGATGHRQGGHDVRETDLASSLSLRWPRPCEDQTCRVDRR